MTSIRAKFKALYPDLTALTILGALPYLVFWFLWAPNPEDRSIFVGDILVGAYPTRVYVHRLLTQGEMPLWNPYQLGGIPLLADIQVAVYYFPNLIFDFIFWNRDITYPAFEALVVFHYCLGAILLYGYLRHLKIGPWAALVGAIAFEFNGFFVGHHGHYSMFSVVVWLPGILWMLDKAWAAAGRGDRILYTVAAGFFMSQLLMGGHPQMTFYCSIFIVAYFCFRLVINFRVWRFFLFEGPIWNWFSNPIFQIPLILGIAGIIGLGIASIGLLPMFELLGRSLRSEPSLEFASQYSLLPRNLITLLMPEFLNWSGTEFRIFAGVLTLLLVLITWIVPEAPRPEVIFFFGAMIVAFILSLGGFTAIHGWFYRFLPGFGSVRVAARIFYFANFSLAILAAFGAQILFEQMSDAERERLSRFVSSIKPVFGLLGIVLIGLFGVIAFYYQAVGDEFYFYDTFSVGVIDGSNPFFHFSQLTNHYMIFLIFFGCGILILSLRASQRVPPNVIIAATIALMTIDITAYAYQHDTRKVPDINQVKLNGFQVEPMEWWDVQDQQELITFLEEVPLPNRVDNEAEALAANYSQVWEVLFSSGYNVLDLIERADLRERWPLLSRSVQWDLFNVHYIISRSDMDEVPEEGAELILDTSQGRIWSRANKPSYAHFSTRFRPISSGTPINAYLNQNEEGLYAQPSINIPLPELKKLVAENWPEVAADDSLYTIGDTGINSPVDISIISGGIDSYGGILIDGESVTEERRGLHVVVLDPESGELMGVEVFDIFRFDRDSAKFAHMIDQIEEGNIVILAIYDEATLRMDEDGRAAIRKLGGVETLENKFGYAYGLVGIKGAPEGSAIEQISENNVTIDIGLAAFEASSDETELQFEGAVVSYKQDEIKLLVKNSDQGLLTISESIYPGWEVFVNGIEEEIVQVNGLFRGVFIGPSPEEEVNEILFRFNPPLVNLGLILSVTTLGLSLSTLILVLLFPLLDLLRKRFNELGVPAPAPVAQAAVADSVGGENQNG